MTSDPQPPKEAKSSQSDDDGATRRSFQDARQRRFAAACTRELLVLTDEEMGTKALAACGGD